MKLFVWQLSAVAIRIYTDKTHLLCDVKRYVIYTIRSRVKEEGPFFFISCQQNSLCCATATEMSCNCFLHRSLLLLVSCIICFLEVTVVITYQVMKSTWSYVRLSVCLSDAVPSSS